MTGVDPQSPEPQSGQWFSILPSLPAAAIGWLYPGRCALCLAPAADGICPGCEADLVRPGPQCPNCAEPLPVDGQCPSCQRCQPVLEAVWVPFTYAWPLSQLLLAYKTGQRPQLARPLGWLFSRHLPEAATTGIDCVIPVPLHERRLAQRGFNQAEDLAQILCRSRGLRLDSRVVRRVVATPTQQGLGRRARRNNLCGAFAAQCDLSGLNVLLLDDVMTTGTTLNELAREVRRAGAARVVAVALARA